MNPLSVEVVAKLTALRAQTGLEVLSVPIDHAAMVWDCRAGSEIDTDFPNEDRQQFRTVLAGRCGVLEQEAICALLFRKRSAREKFLKNNPKLRTTLVTRWPGVQVLWLRVGGRVPGNLDLAEFTWCSEGLVPVGLAELPAGHFLVHAGEIVRVSFQDLKWEPLEGDACEIDLLEQEVGRRYRQTSKGTHLNVRFWSKLFTRKFNLTFNPASDQFQLRQTQPEAVVCLTEPAMIEALFGCLEKVSRDEPGFPVKELRLARIQELVRLMKYEVARELRSEREVVDELIESEVVSVPGGMLTSKALWSRFLAESRAQGLPLCPERNFYQLVRQKIRARFGIGQSHDRRDGSGNPRFYRHLGLRPERLVIVQLRDAAIQGSPVSVHFNQPTVDGYAQ